MQGAESEHHLKTFQYRFFSTLLWRWFKPVATVVSTYTNKKRIEE